ncbi:MAG: hypothetical protein WBY44_16205 [Bryobacteraceae bacterium]
MAWKLPRQATLAAVSGVGVIAFLALQLVRPAISHSPVTADLRAGEPRYPIGAVLALVTWTKQEDDRWFGARIPAEVKSVEFVGVTAGRMATLHILIRIPKADNS